MSAGFSAARKATRPWLSPSGLKIHWLKSTVTAWSGTNGVTASGDR